MKRIVLWILAAALLLSLVSCHREVDLEPSPYGQGDFDTSGDVALTTEYPTYASSVTSYRYSVTNKTEETVTFGQQYSIELLSDGVWQSLPLLEDVGWDDIGYEAAPGETVSNAFSFWPYDFTVTDGTYRLVKSVTLGSGEERLLCREFSIGRSHLQRIFREQTGLGAIEYFCQMRIRAAKRLIRENRMNLSDTARALGYTSIHYFSKQFKKITGMPPSEYQNFIRTAGSDPVCQHIDLDQKKLTPRVSADTDPLSFKPRWHPLRCPYLPDK